MAEDGTIRDVIAAELKEGFAKTTSVIASNTSEILGSELGGLFDEIKSFTSGALGMLVGGVKSMFNLGFQNKQYKEEKTQTSLLTSILGIFKRQEKRKLASFSDDGIGKSFLSMLSNVEKWFMMGILGLITFITTTLSIAIGAYIGKVLLPFKVIKDFFQMIGVWFTEIQKPIKSLSKIKLFDTINDTLLSIKNSFLGLSKIKLIDTINDSVKQLENGFKLLPKTFNSMLMLPEKLHSSMASKMLQVLDNVEDIVEGSYTRVLRFYERWFVNTINFIKNFKPIDFLKNIGNKFITIGKGIVNGVMSIGKSISANVISWIKPIMDIIKNSKIFSFVAKMFGHLVWGLKKLAWPLTAIFGVFDFIKGFKIEGDFVTKMKSGISQVLIGFFDLPIKLIGWVSDWILEQFKIKIDGGVASKIVAGIQTYVSLVFNIFKKMFDDFKFTIKHIGTQLTAIGNIFFNQISIINNILSGNIDGIKENINNIKVNLGILFNSMKEWFFHFIDMLVPFKMSDLTQVRQKLIEQSMVLINWLKNSIQTIYNDTKSMVTSFFTNIKDSIINSLSSWNTELGISNTLKGFWESIKNSFTKMVSLLDPSKWLDFSAIVLPESITKIFDVVKNIPNTINEWLTGKLSTMINKLPDFLPLPDFLNNMKSVKAETKPVQSMSPVSAGLMSSPIINVKPEQKEESQTIKDIKNIANKMLGAMGNMNGTMQQSVTAQTNISNTMVSQQNSTNNSQSKIPEDNEFFGISLLNGIR